QQMASTSASSALVPLCPFTSCTTPSHMTCPLSAPTGHVQPRTSRVHHGWCSMSRLSGVQSVTSNRQPSGDDRMGSIGQNIRHRREAIGMSKAEMARQLGTDPSRITSWEADKSAPAATAITHITRVLGFSVSELLGEVPIGLDLSGKWFAAWQTTRDKKPAVNRHTLITTHAGEWAYF